MTRRLAAFATFLATVPVLGGVAWAERQAPRCSDEMSALLLRHARRHGVPIDLLHRVVIRESRYNTAAHHARYWGLMQITYATARSMGYNGSPAGLLDANTNLTYGVPYLANAYMLSHGSDDRAVRLYASGYYGSAKQQGKISVLRTAASPPMAPEPIVAIAAPANPVSRLVGLLTGAPAPAPAPVTVAAAEAPSATPAADEHAGKDAPSAGSAANAKPASTKATAQAKAATRTARLAGKSRTKPARVEEAEEVAAAAPADELRGSMDRTAEATQPAEAAPAAAPEPPKPSRASRSRIAAAKRGGSKTTAPNAVEQIAAAEADVPSDDGAAVEAPSARKPAGATARRHAGTKTAAATTTDADAAGTSSRERTAQKALPSRHAHAVVQAAASKADLQPHGQ